MKKFFILLVLILFIAPLGADAKSDKVIRIAQITDACVSTADENTKTSQEYLLKAIQDINKRNDVDFVVFTGNNIAKSNMDCLQTFFEITGTLQKPYYVLLGNKDSHKASGIAKDNFMKIVKKFNKIQKTNPNFCLSVNSDIKAVFVDGAPPNILGNHGFFSDETLCWLKTTLDKNKSKRIIIFQHPPIIPPDDNPGLATLEPERYNMLLIRNPNILLLASGHYNKDSVQVDENGITHISTPSLLLSGKYRIIELRDNSRISGNKKDYKIKTELITIEEKKETK